MGVDLVAHNPGFGFEVITVISLTAGTMLLMWLGDQITERGIGNGISLIITIGIVARLPAALIQAWRTFVPANGAPGQVSPIILVLMVAFFIAVIASIIILTQAQRKISVQYARRIVGRKEYRGGTQTLPLKLNYAGVMPIIFGQALLLFPATIVNLLFKNSRTAQDIAQSLTSGWMHYVFYGLMIFFFSYFWVAMMFQPSQIADELKKNGGYIPGVRPGKPTADFLDFSMSRLTAAGAIFLVIVATVKYQAQSQTAFAAIVHMATIAIGGTSTATASTPPNIDFYLMLDTSPSMAIPATQAGINSLVTFTPWQDSKAGCAFACHETSPSKETTGTPASPIFGNPGCVDDPQKRPAPCRDNYWLAKNPPDGSAPIQLRIDLVNQAVQNLVDTAQTSATQTGAVYKLAGYTFDDVVANPIPLQLPTAATKTQAQNGINMLVVDHENSDNGDQNTIFDSSTDTTAGAFPKLRTAMAAAYNNAGAGNGTNALGDHPQQVLMIVTDGISDEPYGGSRIYKPLGGSTNLGSMSSQICTTIKSNPNVRIAVLYLVYTPLPMNGGGVLVCAEGRPGAGRNITDPEQLRLARAVLSGERRRRYFDRAQQSLQCRRQERAPLVLRRACLLRPPSASA